MILIHMVFKLKYTFLKFVAFTHKLITHQPSLISYKSLLSWLTHRIKYKLIITSMCEEHTSNLA